MPKMFFNSENCQGATSDLTGKYYAADKQGFIHVDSPADAKFLQSGGYIQAGGMPRIKKYWVCEACNWDASINSCGKCGSTSLHKVEK